eukprot:scaffold326_cov334-Pinguiococcus_pyrenoidosus.AAC.1
MALVSGVDLRKDIFGKNKRSQISTIGKTLVGATEVTSSPDFDDLWTSAVQGFSSFFTAFAINDTGVMDKDVFTQALYEFHAERLLAQRKDPGQNPSFEGIRTAIARGLEGIYRYVTQDVGSIKALQASLALAQDQADILTDPERLAEYLESLQQSARAERVSSFQLDFAYSCGIMFFSISKRTLANGFVKRSARFMSDGT